LCAPASRGADPAFCLLLFDGVSRNGEIDAMLSARAENWRLARMPTVDRNILRIGAFELLHMKETPLPLLSMKRSSWPVATARDSSAFVNGVLDRLRRESTSEPEASAN